MEDNEPLFIRGVEFIDLENFEYLWFFHGENGLLVIKIGQQLTFKRINDQITNLSTLIKLPLIKLNPKL